MERITISPWFREGIPCIEQQTEKRDGEKESEEMERKSDARAKVGRAGLVERATLSLSKWPTKQYHKSNARKNVAGLIYSISLQQY